MTLAERGEVPVALQHDVMPDRDLRHRDGNGQHGGDGDGQVGRHHGPPSS
jgi:hypothetical protein